MIIDVEHALPAIDDRAPAGIFGQLAGEGPVRLIVEAWKPERLGHALVFLALVGRAFLVIGSLVRDLLLAARRLVHVLAVGGRAGRHFVGPGLGLVHIGRNLDDDFAAIVEDEAAVSLERQTIIELSRTPETRRQE